MKRGSVVGPLLLIGIGALFLANNVRPDISVMDIIASFWPFILIGWGAIRLLEIFVLMARGKPLPVSGITGGEWALIIFISLIGSGVYVVNRNIGGWGPMHLRVKGVEVFGEPFDFPIAERNVPAPKPVRVIVDVDRGNIRIVGTDSELVKVSGRKSIRAMKQQDADKANQDSPVEVTTKGASVIVRSQGHKFHGERFISVDLDIEVPRSAIVEARGRYGDFDISDIEGNVQIESENAGVRMQNIGGAVIVDTRRSDIIRAVNVAGTIELRGNGSDVELEDIQGQVSIAGSYSGEMQFRNLSSPLRLEDNGHHNSEIRAESIPGQLRVGRGHAVGERMVGPLVINARSKDVQLSEFTGAATIAIDKGDVELRPGKLPIAKLDITTTSGHIDVALPEGARFALKGTADRGEITNDFGQPLEVVDEGRRATISGSVGSGPQISLSAERGSVTVRKGSVIEELPQKADKADRTEKI